MHDFNKETQAINVLGGFVVLRKPLIYFVLNILLIACLFTLYVYLIVMAVITMMVTYNDKAVMVRAFQTLCLLLAGIVIPGIRYFTSYSLSTALESLKNGVFKYSEEGPIEEKYNYIKDNRIYQIRFLTVWVTRLNFSVSIVNTFVPPIVQLIRLKGEDSDWLVNPYLPLPLYAPFNTRSYLGFAVSFLTHGIFQFFFYSSIVCLVETYMSCAFQLIAQLEILNHSLSNIEKRAYFKLQGPQQLLVDNSSSSTDDRALQQCFYICLRENILHHHAIVR